MRLVMYNISRLRHQRDSMALVTFIGVWGTVQPTRRQSERWLEMAEEARAIADSMRDPQSKEAMQQIAASYDALARRAQALEAHAGDATSAGNP